MLTEAVSFVCAVALKTLCMHQASGPVTCPHQDAASSVMVVIVGKQATLPARGLTRELASLRELPKPQDGDVGRLLRHWLPNVVLRDLAFHESLLTLPGREPIAAAASSAQDGSGLLFHGSASRRLSLFSCCLYEPFWDLSGALQWSADGSARFGASSPGRTVHDQWQKGLQYIMQSPRQ